MQANVRTDLSINQRSEVQANAKPAKSAPVVLDASLLRHVGGGLGPNGTWAAASASTATALGPNGTW
jgi:hypothetical protein